MARADERWTWARGVATSAAQEWTSATFPLANGRSFRQAMVHSAFWRDRAAERRPYSLDVLRIWWTTAESRLRRSWLLHSPPPRRPPYASAWPVFWATLRKSSPSRRSMPLGFD